MSLLLHEILHFVQDDIYKVNSDMRDLFQEDKLGDSPVIEAGAVKSVLVPYPIDKAYDYAVPEDMDVRDGDYVCVPLGGREVPAVVWSASAPSELQRDYSPKKLKSVVTHYDMKPMPQVHRDFIAWVARYTLAPLGSVLKMAASVPAGLEPPKPVTGYKAVEDVSLKLTEKQQIVMDVMADGQIRRAAEIADQAGCSAGIVKTLEKKGALQAVDVFNPAPCKAPDPARKGAELSEAQQRTADQLSGGDYKVALLDGVTGAGKTEVYFEAVAAALKKGGRF